MLLRFVFLLAALILPVGVCGQNQLDVSVSLSLTPSTIRSGQSARAVVKLRNPHVNETVSLQAVATYTDFAGVQRTVYSNVVSITIDYSIPVRITIPPGKVRPIPGTAKFDGLPIEPADASGLDFDVVLPGDNREHSLELEVTK